VDLATDQNGSYAKVAWLGAPKCGIFKGFSPRKIYLFFS
jgi:hypothetical protein